MYIFKVTYMNMDTEELRTSNIEMNICSVQNMCYRKKE